MGEHGDLGLLSSIRSLVHGDYRKPTGVFGGGNGIEVPSFRI